MQTAPETKEKFDVGAGGFYQITQASNGNFIREDTTESGGGLISFRQPYKPWLGYEANVGFTKFYEAYNKGVVKTESNVTDLTSPTCCNRPPVYGFQPFFSIGGGIIYFSPIAGYPHHHQLARRPIFRPSCCLNSPTPWASTTLCSSGLACADSFAA